MYLSLVSFAKQHNQQLQGKNRSEPFDADILRAENRLLRHQLYDVAIPYSKTTKRGGRSGKHAANAQSDDLSWLNIRC